MSESRNFRDGSSQVIIWRQMSGLLMTMGAIALLEVLFHSGFSVEQLSVIYALAVVCGAALGGRRIGLVSAAIALLHAGIRLAVTGSLQTNGTENLLQLLLLGGGTVAIALIVGHLKAGANPQEWERLKALEIEYKHFRVAFEQLPAGVVILEASSNPTLLATKRAQEIWPTVLSPRAIASARPSGVESPTETLSPADEWPLAEVMRTGEVVKNQEMEIVRLDGSRRVVWVNASPVRDRNGQIVAAIATFCDLSESRRIEEVLWQVIQKLSFHVQNSPLAIVEWDREVRLSRWSQEAENIFGWPTAQVLGKHPSQWPFIFGDDLQAFNDAIARLIDGTEHHNVVSTRNYRFNQELRHCEWYNSALLDDAGDLVSILSLVLDVSDRQRAEKENIELQAKLEQRVKELQTLLDVIPIGIAIADDPTCQNLRINPAFAKLLGHSPPEDLAVSSIDSPLWTEFTLQRNGRPLSPADLPMRTAAAQGIEVLDIEMDLIRVDGKIVNLLHRAAPLFNEQGDASGCVGVFLDITERQRAEAARSQLLVREQAARAEAEAAERARAESEALLSALLESAPVGFCFYDCELRYVRINQFLADINGHAIADHIGRRVGEILPVELAATVTMILRQVLTTGEPIINLELSTQTFAIESQSRYFLGNYYPVYSSDHQILGIGVSLADITEFKLVEEALRQSEERFRIAQELSIDGFMILRSVRNEHQEIQDFEIEYLNPSLAKMFKISPKIVRGKKLLAVLPDHESSGLLGHYVQVVKSRKSQALEIFYHSEEIQGWFRIMAVKLEDGVAVSFSDITQRKQTELELHQREQEFRALVENAPDIIARLDQDMRYLYINPVIEEITKIAPEKMIGKTHQELGINPLFFQTLEESCQTIFANQAESYTEFNLLSQTGWRFYQTRMVPEFNPDGSVNSILAIARDITELKKTEAALRENEFRLRRVIESNMIGIGFWKMNGQITEANDALLALIGYSREELYTGNLNWREMTPLEHQDLESQAWEEIREFGFCSPYEKEFICKDGSYIPILVGGAIVEENSDSGVFFAIDLSDRKSLQESLEETNQMLDSLIQACPLAITVFNIDDGTIKLVNPAAERIFGWSKAEVIGKFVPTVPPEKRTEFLAHLNTIRRGETLGEVELRLHKKNGDAIDVSVWAAPVKDAKGNISCISLAADISDRKILEEELRSALTKLTFHVDNSPLAVVEWDHNFHVARWSQQAEELFGWKASEVLGKHPREWKFVFDEDLEATNGILSRLIQGIEERNISPNRNYTKNGEVVYCEWYNSALLDREGHLVSVLSLVLDVTDRKHLEAQLRRQAEDLAKANRIKDEFLAVLSHELRSPLNAILGWAQMLRTRQLSPTATAKALETIERNARLQTQLIEDLLDVSRILRGKLSLNITPVNLASIIEAAIDTGRLAAQAKSIDVRSFLDPAIGFVMGDSNRLQQVVWNLLSNAIKFTPSGGSITIQLTLQQNYARIQVIDSGQGIRADFLPHVFDYFRQADSSSTRTQGGLGLGLAIVRHLIELHGGEVFAQSPGEGQGSTFTVLLPLGNHDTPQGNEDGESLPTQALHLSHSVLEGVRILVVDDEADGRDYVASVLKYAGAEVIAVASAARAIALLQQTKPDILVSDIAMPSENGYSLIRKIRALPASAGGNIKAIALTAYAREEDRLQSLQAGFEQHLAKPVAPTELVAAVAKLVGRDLNAVRSRE